MYSRHIKNHDHASLPEGFVNVSTTLLVLEINYKEIIVTTCP